MGKHDGSRRVLRRVKQVKKGPSSHAQTQTHTGWETERRNSSLRSGHKTTTTLE